MEEQKFVPIEIVEKELCELFDYFASVDEKSQGQSQGQSQDQDQSQAHSFCQDIVDHVERISNIPQGPDKEEILAPIHQDFFVKYGIVGMMGVIILSADGGRDLEYFQDVTEREIFRTGVPSDTYGALMGIILKILHNQLPSSSDELKKMHAQSNNEYEKSLLQEELVSSASNERQDEINLRLNELMAFPVLFSDDIMESFQYIGSMIEDITQIKNYVDELVNIEIQAVFLGCDK